MVPVFRAEDVRRAVPSLDAFDAVREAFLAYARGEWTMPPKIYVTNYPAGDFRAMPALGGGHALLKWVTSCLGNPAHGLPTVTGLVLLPTLRTEGCWPYWMPQPSRRSGRRQRPSSRRTRSRSPMLRPSPSSVAA